MIGHSHGRIWGRPTVSDTKAEGQSSVLDLRGVAVRGMAAVACRSVVQMRADACRCVQMRADACRCVVQRGGTYWWCRWVVPAGTELPTYEHAGLGYI